VLLLSMAAWKKKTGKKMPAVPLIGLSAVLGAVAYSV